MVSFSSFYAAVFTFLCRSDANKRTYNHKLPSTGLIQLAEVCTEHITPFFLQTEPEWIKTNFFLTINKKKQSKIKLKFL